MEAARAAKKEREDADKADADKNTEVVDSFIYNLKHAAKISASTGGSSVAVRVDRNHLTDYVAQYLAGDDPERVAYFLRDVKKAATEHMPDVVIETHNHYIQCGCEENYFVATVCLSWA